MQQLELKLGPASAFDYRSIVLPLVKSFLRVRNGVVSHLYLLLMGYCSTQALAPFYPWFCWQLHLEDLVDKDAAEKSDAAREAFLAELALSEKKNINKGGESKQLQDKSKDKKKNKDNRKPKDIKVRIILSLLQFSMPCF